MNKNQLEIIYPDLEKIGRVEIGNFPTSVERLTNLEKFLNTKTEIWIKRDDMSSNIYGGNKVRKLEYIFADAKKKNSKKVLSVGGIGSNHTLAVTLLGKELGFQSMHLLFEQPLTEHVRENLLTEFYFGAELHYTGGYVNTALTGLSLLLKEKFKEGNYPYFVPPGGSNPLGTVGFTNGAFELKKQIDNGELPEPEIIFATLGSCGTLAGLLLGISLSGINSALSGVRVVDRIVSNRSAVIKLSKKTNKLLKKYSTEIPDFVTPNKEKFFVLHDYFGGQYGKYTEKGINARKILADTEGITLDGTYTGKTFAGLIDYIKENTPKRVLFWHTYNNSVDNSKFLQEVNYEELPKNLHKFFNGKKELLGDF